MYKDSGSGSGSGWVSLGGYAKQISAGHRRHLRPVRLGHRAQRRPLVQPRARLGQPGRLRDGSQRAGHLEFRCQPARRPGVRRRQGARGLTPPAGTSFTSLGGYIQTSSGSASNNTNTWAPAARDISAVSWLGPFFLKHNAVYAIAPDDSVEVSFAGGSFTNLGGYAKQVSAGLDATGSPEVYAIGADNAVWVKDGSGPWVSLGGYAKEISATVENTVYAIGYGRRRLGQQWGSGWVSLGLYAKQISAGADANGNPEVFAIGFDDAV